MERKTSAIAITLLGVLILGMRSGQGCLDDLRSVYRTMKEQLSGEKTSRISYTTRMVTRTARGDRQTTNASVEVIGNRQKLQLLSREMELYMDQSVIVSVLVRTREIHIGNNPVANQSADRMKFFGAFQDSLLATSSEESCRTTKDGATEVTLVMSNGVRDRLKIDRCVFTIDKSKRQLKKLQMNYVRGWMIEVNETEFKEVDGDYKGELLPNGALRAVLNTNGQLLAKYSGYRLSDMRTKNHQRSK